MAGPDRDRARWRWADPASLLQGEAQNAFALLHGAAERGREPLGAPLAPAAAALCERSRAAIRGEFGQEREQGRKLALDAVVSAATGFLERDQSRGLGGVPERCQRQPMPSMRHLLPPPHERAVPLGQSGRLGHYPQRDGL